MKLDQLRSVYFDSFDKKAKRNKKLLIHYRKGELLANKQTEKQKVHILLNSLYYYIAAAVSKLYDNLSFLLQIHH